LSLYPAPLLLVFVGFVWPPWVTWGGISGEDFRKNSQEVSTIENERGSLYAGNKPEITHLVIYLFSTVFLFTAVPPSGGAAVVRSPTTHHWIKKEKKSLD
jgi:hypothetical protein